jgi:hypothetical protein
VFLALRTRWAWASSRATLVQERADSLILAAISQRKGVSRTAATGAGLPNLHRIVIEFHKDILAESFGRGKSHVSATDRHNGVCFVSVGIYVPTTNLQDKLPCDYARSMFLVTDSYSLESSKDFMAQHGGAKLSDQDVEKIERHLYQD